MKLTKAEIEILVKAKEFGFKAETAREVVCQLADAIIERCKEEFSTMPLINYQNIDNRQVFMLQLEMKVARDLKTAVESAIMNGEDAAKTLRPE